MVLKLLTPTEVKAAVSKEETRTSTRINVTRETLTALEKKLSTTEADFEAMLARQQVVWAKEEEEHVKDVVRRQEEIRSLEKQREPLLIPIELEQKRAHDLYVEAEAVLSKAKQKQKDNEDVGEILQQRLDDVEDRADELTSRDAKTAAKEETNRNREKVIGDLSSELQKRWNDFLVYEKTSKDAIQDEKDKLRLRSLGLDAKEESLTNTETYLKNFDRQIKDRYQTLLRTEQRISLTNPHVANDLTHPGREPQAD